MELRRKLTTIIVTDVVGYGRLIADDEEATLRRLEVFRGLWQDCAARHHGRIFNSAGDAVLIEFSSPVEAMRCALEFQERAAEQNRALVERRQMHFRVGISIGDVVERGSDLLGDGVNVAARLQGLASPGGICVTSWVREAISNKLEVGYKDMGEQTVKSMPQPIHVYAVVSPEEARAVVRGAAGAASGDWLDRLTTSWRAISIAAGVLVVAGAGMTFLAVRLRAPVAPAASAPQALPAAAPSKVVIVPVEAPRQPATSPAPAAAQPQPQPPVSAPVKTAALDAREPAPKPPEDGPRKAAESFRDCADCPEMVVLPRGDFLFGTSDTEVAALKRRHPEAAEVFDREMPQRKVSITETLAVSRTHVTRGEFAAFVKATGHSVAAGCMSHTQANWKLDPQRNWRAPGFPQEDSHPVVCVSWRDAKAYAAWVAQRTGKPYRLLSETEAEFAIRGTTQATPQPIYHFGSDAAKLCEHGNVGDLTGADALVFWDIVRVAQCRDGFVHTAPAGRFKPNRFGLHDVHGNAWTWTEDCENPNHLSHPGDARPRTSGNCSERIIRGGAWQDVVVLQRSASRYTQKADARDDNTGFRIARAIAP